MTSRKKWRITYQGSDATDQFTSEKATYEFVRALGSRWSSPDRGDMSQHLVVWFAEKGRDGWGRWQRFDEVDLVDYA